MQTITRGCLLGLYQEQFAVCDGHSSDAGTAIGGSPESRDRHAQCGSGDLNQGPDGGNAGSQASRHADCPLVANGSHLKGAIPSHGDDDRDHSGLDKMDPIDWFTAFFEDLSLLYGNFPQMAAQERQVGRWKRREQPISDFLPAETVSFFIWHVGSPTVRYPTDSSPECKVQFYG